jgi:transposase
MLMIPSNVKIYLAAGRTDMRKSFDGLAAAARDVIGLDPLSGHLFCFTNRARNRLKVLYWDRSGFWVFAKRLERGTFAWPSVAAAGERRVEMSYETFTLLLGGLDAKAITKRRWFDLAPGSEAAKNIFGRHDKRATTGDSRAFTSSR